jgi:hypothetical protein
VPSLRDSPAFLLAFPALTVPGYHMPPLRGWSLIWLSLHRSLGNQSVTTAPFSSLQSLSRRRQRDRFS